MQTVKLARPAILVMILASSATVEAEWLGMGAFRPGATVSRDGQNRPCYVPGGACLPGPHVTVRVGKPSRVIPPGSRRLKMAPPDAWVYTSWKFEAPVTETGEDLARSTAQTSPSSRTPR